MREKFFMGVRLDRDMFKKKWLNIAKCASQRLWMWKFMAIKCVAKKIIDSAREKMFICHKPKYKFGLLWKKFKHLSPPKNIQTIR